MGCILVHIRSLASLSPQECIEKLRSIENILQKQEERYSVESRKAKEQALQHVKQDSRVLALACLRRRKMLDAQIKNISMRRAVCEQKRLSIEQLSSVGMQVMAMKETARTFKSFLKENDINKVEDIADQLSDAIASTCEITELISEELPLLSHDDDDDIESELQSLLLTQHIEKNLDFPVAPNTELNKESKSNSDEKKGRVAARVF